MNKIIYGIGKGLLIGLCVGIACSVVFDFYSVGDCTIQWIGAFFGCGSCSKGVAEYFGSEVVQKSLLYSIAVCTVGGGYFGVVDALQERKKSRKKQMTLDEQSAKRQRAHWAKTTQDTAFKTLTTCILNEDTNKSGVIQSPNRADEIINNIEMEINSSAELLGFISEITNERDSAQ